MYRSRLRRYALWGALAALALSQVRPPSTHAKGLSIKESAGRANERNTRLKQRWDNAWSGGKSASFTKLGGVSARVHEVRIGREKYIVRAPRRGADLGFRQHNAAHIVLTLFGHSDMVAPAFLTKAPTTIGQGKHTINAGEPIMVVRHAGGKYQPGNAVGDLSRVPEKVRIAGAAYHAAAQERDGKTENTLVHSDGEKIKLIDFDNTLGIGVDRDGTAGAKNGQRGVIPSAFWPGSGMALAYTTPQKGKTDLSSGVRRGLYKLEKAGDADMKQLARSLGLKSAEATVLHQGAKAVRAQGIDATISAFLSDKWNRRPR